MYQRELSQQQIDTSQGRNERQVSSGRSVHFYEDDTVFLDSLSEFVGAALGAGGACVVIATGAHRLGLADRLRAAGIDLSFTTAMNRFIAVDAAETLTRFMVNGVPDEKLFYAAIEPDLVRARKALRRSSTSVAAFGEMVALLWQRGQSEAAIEVERLWDCLAQRHAFSFRSAYPTGLLSDQAQHELFRQVCSSHTQFVHSDSSRTFPPEADRHRMISSLQQQAWTMNAVMKGREREISQLKHVEEQLQRSEEFARNLVECCADCIQVLDLDGRIQYINPPGLRAMEIDGESCLLGHRWAEFWKDDERALAESALETALAGGAGSFQGSYTTAQGTVQFWDVKVSPVLNAQGKVDRLMAISRDITELKTAQQAAIESEKQATAGRLAATIAHEINNPLEVVTNFIYLAQTSEGVPEQVSGYLEIADRQLSRVAQISRQTLGFYRGSSKNEWTSVSELVDDVLLIYERRLSAKGIETLIRIDPNLKVFGKEGELRQALLNLTANAIDASRNGGKLWFRARRSKDWARGMSDGIRITLGDNGSGMSAEVQRSLFVPFFTTKLHRGTGIGLWVTKCLIEQQGGTMHFRSKQGKEAGTVMTIFLPGTHEAQAETEVVAA